MYKKNLFGSLKLQKERDTQKKLGCLIQGVTLIEIPFWWDGKEQSLISTIQLYRPELFQNKKLELGFSVITSPKYQQDVTFYQPTCSIIWQD
jgi:hypothetical protein